MKAAAAVGVPARLDPDAVYVTPTGRLCRLAGMDRRLGVDAQALMQYVAKPGDRVKGDWSSDGFALRRENWRVLRLYTGGGA